MGLSVRAFNCLKAASIETLDQLLSWKPAQLMELPNFGSKCLNEITETVQRLGHSWIYDRADAEGTQKQPPVEEGGAPLACLLEVRELVSEATLTERFIENGWHTVADLALHSVESIVKLASLTIEDKLDFQRALRALSLELPVELPTWFLNNMSALRAAFSEELRHLEFPTTHGGIEASYWKGPQVSQSLNEDIALLIPKSYDERKREIVLDLLGLRGGDPLTLEEVAKAQTPSLTRERVRQIARPVIDALSERGSELPCLLKAVAVLKRLAPCSRKHAEQALIGEKILDAPITVAAILGLAQRSSLSHDLLLEGNALLNAETAELLRPVVRAAGKLSSRWGVADWQDLELSVPTVAQMPSIKNLLYEVVWLDASQRYFVMPDRENSLANRLARILKVTPRLKLAEAYRGAFRDPRMEKERLPETMFAAFCDVWPWCSVDGDEVVAKTELPPSEASGDDLLVLLLREIGRPVRRRELTERAVEQGIRLETVTVALSYSNVIASKNGYFAVIGDPQLEECGRSDKSFVAEVLKFAEDSGHGKLVPNENAHEFPGLLMLAVEERVATLGLKAPWSVSELCLSERDRDRLLNWGEVAKWDFSDDFSNYQMNSGQKVRKRAALGLAFLLFASEAARRFGNAGSVWPAIERGLGEQQQQLFMFRSGLPKPALREAVETACRTFGLRHGFEDFGQQVWVRTVGLQSAILCSQIPELGLLLDEPDYLRPLVVQLLMDMEGPNASASFLESWKLLQGVRLGLIHEKEALGRFGSDVWLSPFPPHELLAQCLTAKQGHTRSATESQTLTPEEAYQYFLAPVLRWTSDEAYLEYSLNSWAPPWHESGALVLFCEDPFRKERIPIENDRWQLTGGPVRLPLAQREGLGFRFKLMQGREEVFAGWKHAGLPTEILFTFFRASGAMVPSVHEVLPREDAVVLHRADVQLVGLDVSPVFRAVLRGMYRLTRVPAHMMAQIRLLDADGVTLWSLPTPDQPGLGGGEALLAMRGGKWGTAAEVTLPDLPWAADRLRLNSGEVLLISRSNGRTWLKSSPGLGRAQTGLLHGSLGKHAYSARVKLHRLGTDFGVALEMNGGWQPLDGSESLDVATLRTHRLLTKVKAPLDVQKDICWMEGRRTLAGLRAVGTFLAGMHGLGESLNVVRGTYNSSEVELPVARAVTDAGFLRSVQLEVDGTWTAHLPFDGPIEGGHSLWIWAADSALPRKVPAELVEKNGFMLRWISPTKAAVFGWAFSVDGARIGSILNPESLAKLMRNLFAIPWAEAALWLRWWHAPVLHPEVRDLVAKKAHEDPVETIKAWLLPADENSGLIMRRDSGRSVECCSPREFMGVAPDLKTSAGTSQGCWHLDGGYRERQPKTSASRSRGITSTDESNSSGRRCHAGIA